MKLNNDLADKIGAVDRTVESRLHNGRAARVVTARRSYDTSIDDLWDALTNPERIPRWFLPITGDLQLGGRYQLEGNAGGEISRCEAPCFLSVTWEYGGDVSWVNVTLELDANGDASLLLEHIAHVPDEFWDQFGPGATGVGWDQALLGLDLYTSTGRAIEPAEAAAWAMSDEGKAFITQSSDAWRRASVASGTDPAAARAAADRTTSFYTGVEADTTSDPTEG